MKKNTLLILFAIGIIALLGFPTFVYMYTASTASELSSLHSNIPYEKINITNVYSNATRNAVFVDVTSTTPEVNEDGRVLNTTSKITYAMIRDMNGTTVAREELSAFILKGESTTLSFYCPLPSGDYTVNLITSSGGSFVSPSFTVKTPSWTPMESIVNLGTASFPSLALDSSGYPQIAVGYNSPSFSMASVGLKYAVWTGSSWNIQTVDSAEDAAIFPSLALDSAGNPHVSYGDFVNGIWKFAEWTGTTWSIQTVNSTRGTGGYTSLALDSNGYPHICYYDMRSHALKLAEWTGTAWSVQTVNSTRGGVEWISLALDSEGKPHISYQNGNSPNYYLKFAEWTGTTWNMQVVDSIGNAHATSSMALDGNGNPHISYYDETNHALKLADRIGTTWSIQTVESAGKYGVSSSLALDSSDRPRISYVDDLSHYLKFAEWTGTAWSVQTVDSGNIGQCTSLALDSSGRAYISYRNIDLHTLMIIFQS